MTAIVKKHRPKDSAVIHNQKLIGITWKRRVRCSICKELSTRETIHYHSGKVICDETCWDERLRSTE